MAEHWLGHMLFFFLSLNSMYLCVCSCIFSILRSDSISKSLIARTNESLEISIAGGIVWRAHVFLFSFFFGSRVFLHFSHIYQYSTKSYLRTREWILCLCIEYSNTTNCVHAIAKLNKFIIIKTEVVLNFAIEMLPKWTTKPKPQRTKKKNRIPPQVSHGNFMKLWLHFKLLWFCLWTSIARYFYSFLLSFFLYFSLARFFPVVECVPLQQKRFIINLILVIQSWQQIEFVAFEFVYLLVFLWSF